MQCSMAHELVDLPKKPNLSYFLYSYGTLLVFLFVKLYFLHHLGVFQFRQGCINPLHSSLYVDIVQALLSKLLKLANYSIITSQVTHDIVKTNPGLELHHC